MNKAKTDGGVDARVAVLGRRVLELKRGPGGKVSGGFPAELRTEIIAAWRESGLPMGPFAEKIGVTGTSLANWVRALPHAKARSARTLSRVKGKRKKKGFRQVRVVRERVGTEGSASRMKPRGFELELPSGARITGLGMEDVAQLVGLQAVAR